MNLFNSTTITTEERIKYALNENFSIPTTEYFTASFVISFSKITTIFTPDIYNKIITIIFNEIFNIFKPSSINIVGNYIITNQKIYGSDDILMFFRKISFSFNFFEILNNELMKKYNHQLDFLGFSAGLLLGNEISLLNKNVFIQFDNKNLFVLADFNSKDTQGILFKSFYLDSRFHSIISDNNFFDNYKNFSFEPVFRDDMFFFKVNLLN